MNVIIIYLVAALSSLAESHEAEESTNIEARGKGKYALLMHFFYVVATKLFILKVIYGIIFYVILTKGWHFVLWFTQYLKKKEHHVEYVDHDYHGYHDHHSHHEQYEPPYHGYGQGPYQGYGTYQEYDKNGYDTKDYVTAYSNKVYDSDGSYSVKKPVTRRY